LIDMTWKDELKKESKKFELWIGSDTVEMKSTGLTFTSRESAFAKIKEEAKTLKRTITGKDGYKGTLRAMDGIYENIMVPRLEYEIREA
tara:strand:+ start:620 stop:886 length:267 start_codon:yes stop_codon:yes gene_type:complete